MSLEEQRQEVVRRYQQGGLGRRAALKELVLSGLTAVGAYMAIGETIEPTPAIAQPSGLSSTPTMFTSLETAVTSPDVVSLLKELQYSAYDDVKRDYARRIIETLGKTKAASDFRVAMRVFENDSNSGKQIDILSQSPNSFGFQRPRDADSATVCVSLGFFLCVSAGS